MKAVLWIAAAVRLVGAVMLVLDVGSAALWIAAITIGRRHRRDRPDPAPSLV